MCRKMAALFALFLASFLVLTSGEQSIAHPMELIQLLVSNSVHDYLDMHTTCESIHSNMESFADEPNVHYENGVLTINGHLNFHDFFPTLAKKFKIPLENITYKCQADTFVVETEVYGDQIVSPYPFDYNEYDKDIWEFTMTDTRISITVSSKTKYDISVLGKLVLLQNALVIDTSVVHKMDYAGVTDEFNFTGSGLANIDARDVPDIVNIFTNLQLPQQIVQEDLTISAVSLSGILQIDQQTWFSIKLLGDNARIAIMLHDPYQFHHDSRWTGFACELFGDIPFKEFYPTMDVKDVPYFGSANTEAIAYIELSTSARFCNPPDGMFADVLLFQPECIEKTDIKAAFNSSIIPYTFRDGAGQTQLHSYPVNNAVTLREILKVYAPGLVLDKMNKQHKFFFDIRTVYNLGIVRITLPLTADEEYIVCVDIIDNQSMSFFYNLLVITKADIKFCLTQEKTLDVSVTGDVEIGSVSFTATIEKSGDDEYTITAKADRFGIVDAISHFHALFFPVAIREVLKGSPFLDFEVLEPHIKYQFSSTSYDQFLEIGGKPSFLGYSLVEMDAVLVHHNTTNDLAAGIFIEAVNLETLLYDVSQIKLDGIPMLKQLNVNACILISPTGMEDHQLRDHDIQKGITLEADMGFPSDCSEDNFCKTIQHLLGANAVFAISGTYESAESFSVSATVKDIDLGKGFILKEVGLVVTVGVESDSIGIIGSLEIPKPNLTFSGEIEIALQEGVEVKLSMSGCWDNAFDQKWLSICNIEGSVGLNPDDPIFLSELGIGGEIKLGNKDCTTPIDAKGYVGFDAENYDNDYFYVEVSKVTFGSLLKAFCWNVDLPKAIQETGFPKGFMASYSTEEKEIKPANLTIPAGFHFKGTLDILGLTGSADIDVDFENEALKLDVELPPISVANGLLEMFKSPNDHSVGPVLNADVEPKTNTFNVSASGYVSVLGSVVYTTLMITDDLYKFTYSAKVLNLFRADFEISAIYKRPLSDASFEIKGCFENDIMKAIEDFIVNVFKKAVDYAEKKIKEAEDDVESKKKVLEDAKGALEQDKHKVDDAYGAFRAAEDSLDAAKEKLDSALSRCPSWVRWACKGIMWIANKAMDAAKWTVQQSSHVLDLAKDALTIAEGAVDGAEGCLDLAVDVLKGVGEACKLALALAQAIKDFGEGIEKIIKIEEITFDTKLSEANIGSFDVTLKGSFLGVEKTLELYIDLKSIASICKQLAEHIGEGFGKFFNEFL